MAGVAQLVEQRIRNAKVGGSTPSTGTKDFKALHRRYRVDVLAFRQGSPHSLRYAWPQSPNRPPKTASLSGPRKRASPALPARDGARARRPFRRRIFRTPPRSASAARSRPHRAARPHRTRLSRHPVRSSRRRLRSARRGLWPRRVPRAGRDWRIEPITRVHPYAPEHGRCAMLGVARFRLIAEEDRAAACAARIPAARVHQVGVEDQDVAGSARDLHRPRLVVAVGRGLTRCRTVAARNDARRAVAGTVVVKIGDGDDRITGPASRQVACSLCFPPSRRGSRLPPATESIARRSWRRQWPAPAAGDTRPAPWNRGPATNVANPRRGGRAIAPRCHAGIEGGAKVVQPVAGIAARSRT